MTPLDVALYGCAFLIASLPIAVGIGIIGCVVLALRERAKQ